MKHVHRERRGKVCLVGAGPGDPALITMRGLECLGEADLVFYDCLVNPVLLEYAPPSTEVFGLGRLAGRGCRRCVSHEEVVQLMVDAAKNGKRVVRLKGGDPAVFGRGADELDAFAEAGIPYEIVPGVTAALAAAAYAGIPITRGQNCSAIALVAGQESSSKSGEAIDYAALATFPGTLIFYMGVASADDWSRALIRAGKPPETPVAVVRRCSWADQETIRCTLGTLVEVIASRDVLPPAMIFVGQIVAQSEERSWFSDRPLFGVRVLLTRPPNQACSAAAKLAELGAEVLLQPAIEIGPPDDWAPLDEALGRPDRYDWMVFSSVNGVRYLLDRLGHGRGDLRRLGRVKLAAIGPATAEELRRYHLRADLVPREYRAEGLAEALIETGRGKRFLLARASRGRDVLARRLEAAGGRVDQVVVYTSSDARRADPEITDALSEGRIDWITVTSSAIARSLAAMFGELLRNARLASISPITSDTLQKLGYRPTAEAAEYTLDGLIEVIRTAGNAWR